MLTGEKDYMDKGARSQARRSAIILMPEKEMIAGNLSFRSCLRRGHQ